MTLTVPDKRAGGRSLWDRLGTAVRAATPWWVVVCVAGAFQSVHAQTIDKVFTYDRPDEFGILQTNDVLVPMRDGFRLTCDLYQPMGPDGQLAAGRFPSFVKDYTGYGRRDTTGSDFVTQTLAAKGYNVIWCNARGSQGRFNSAPAPASIAQIDPWSEQEQQDNHDLIEWLAAQPWSNGKVGQTGLSYGGITTWLVAARQRPPSLKAIVPVTASFDNYRHFTYPGGIPSSDLRGIWPFICSTLTGEPTCSPRVTLEFQTHPNFDAYWQTRRADPGSLSIPTLYFAGHQDIFAGATDPLIAQMRSKPHFSLVLGPWAHDNVWTTGQGTIPKGVLLAFFDKWLAGRSAVPTMPRYAAYQSPVVAGEDRWKSFSQWPPSDAAAVRWVMTTDGALRPEGGAAGLLAYRAELDQLTFDTPAFASEAVVSGPIDVNLRLTFNTTDMNVFARVDQIDSAGNVIDMGYGGQLKMSHRASDSEPAPIVPGLTYPVTIRIPSKFWTIGKGQKLRLTIKSVDSTSLQAVMPGGLVTVSTGGDGSFVKLHLWQP